MTVSHKSNDSVGGADLDTHQEADMNNAHVRELEQTVQRLRLARDQYREDLRVVVSKNKEMSVRNRELEDKLAATATINIIHDPLAIKLEAYDSDDNNDFRKLRNDIQNIKIQNIKSSTLLPGKHGAVHDYLPLPRSTPMPMLKHTASEPASVVAGEGTNKKYPDVPFFHGDKDGWDAWRLHLDAKFRNSAILFPSEWHKIEYIRDHCKD